MREVIVTDAGSRRCARATIADGAGCRVLISSATRGARLKAAAEVARSPWLMFLPPGTVPDATWIDEVRRFVEQSELRGCAGTYAAVFRPASATFRPTLVEAIAPAARRPGRTAESEPGAGDLQDPL